MEKVAWVGTERRGIVWVQGEGIGDDFELSNLVIFVNVKPLKDKKGPQSLEVREGVWFFFLVAQGHSKWGCLTGK